MYKRSGQELLLLLVHPGGPLWAKKDIGAWSIPKGEYKEGEEPLAAAKREFGEELGAQPSGEFWELGALVQPSRKEIVAWAVEADFPVAALRSNIFELEWPPKSGQKKQFPEVDRAAWFSLSEARVKMLPSQRPILDALEALLAPD